MSDLQFAIVGCGRIGQRHAGHIQHSGKLAAVCDIDAIKAEELGKKYNANTYTSIDELLGAEKNLDVVAVCTPNGLHAEHGIKTVLLYNKKSFVGFLGCLYHFTTFLYRYGHWLFTKHIDTCFQCFNTMFCM